LPEIILGIIVVHIEMLYSDDVVEFKPLFQIGSFVLEDRADGDMILFLGRIRVKQAHLKLVFDGQKAPKGFLCQTLDAGIRGFVEYKIPVFMSF